MSVKGLLQLEAKLASLQRDYDKLYGEVVALRVKVNDYEKCK